MKISEQITELLKKRGALITGLEALNAKTAAGGELRDMTEAEQKEFDDGRAEIARLDKKLVEFKAIEDLLSSQAVSVGAIPGAAPKPTPGLEVKTFKPFPGQAFVRYACTLARAKGNLMQAELFAKQWDDTTPEVGQIIKAAVAAGTTTDPNWAAPLVQYNNMASEFIEFLRAKTIIDRIQGMRRVPFMTRIPRQTAGASAGWVGEGLSKPVSALAFDTVLFPFAKIATIIVITQELAKLSTPSAEMLARDDMVRAIVEFMDLQFLDSTVAPLANVHPGAITNGVTPIAATARTVAGITTDVTGMLTAMANANISMEAPVWIMSPAARIFLQTVRTAQDLFAFRDEIATGKFMGYPIIESNNVVVASGVSSIVLIDAAQIMYADDGPVTLDSSSEASLQMDGAPATPPTPLVSLWQQNMLGIKAERFCYWERRRLAAVQVMTGFPHA